MYGTRYTVKRKYDHLITTVGKPYPKAWIIGKTLKEIEHGKHRQKTERGALPTDR